MFNVFTGIGLAALFLIVLWVVDRLRRLRFTMKGAIHQINISNLPKGWYSVVLHCNDEWVMMIGESSGKIFVVYHEGLLPRETCKTGHHFFAGKNDAGTTTTKKTGDPDRDVPS